MKPVFAQGVDIGSAWPLATLVQTPAALVSGLIQPIMLIAGIIFFILIIIAGFNIMSASGSADAHAQEKWKQVLTYGAIGLLIIFASYWILQIINFITKGSLNGLLGS
jgi:hypothetical protein